MTFWLASNMRMAWIMPTISATAEVLDPSSPPPRSVGLGASVFCSAGSVDFQMPPPAAIRRLGALKLTTRSLPRDAAPFETVPSAAMEIGPGTVLSNWTAPPSERTGKPCEVTN